VPTPITRPTSYRTPDGHDVTGVYHGTPVLMLETGAIALTHNLRHALAAYNAYHRDCTGENPEREPGSPMSIVIGWARFEERPDSEWILPTHAEHPEARPAIWVDE
jgi:hypothetical protein